METKDQNNHDFSSISPSALTLLLMKGLTNIPFARRVAELMVQPESYVPDYDNKTLSFWLRVLHFESRYLSINQLLNELPVTNILELSSGFSFRGLAAVLQKNVHYLDTDLPGLIQQKKKILRVLQVETRDTLGKLELLELNALDEQQFAKCLSHFPEGPVVIVNEGLLVYLSTEEKEKLCSIIHKVLSDRGGYWITADIYIKNPADTRVMNFDDKFQAFLDAHKVEENKFDSIDAAAEFFAKAGFAIDKEAEPDYAQMTTLPYLMKNANQQQLTDLGKTGKIHTTWRLRVSDQK